MSGSEPKEVRVSVGSIEICCFEWNASARGRGPTLMVAHATGFHARCYDETLGRLGDRHAIAVDLRGHGRSSHPLIEHWRVFGQDLAAVVTALELDAIVGVGHSMGGHAMIDAAALRPDAFEGLVLFDPVVGEPESYARHTAGHFAQFAGEGHPTARRRNRFGSVEAMVERFADRPPYGHFDPKVFRDYCEFGLVKEEAGEGLVLACPPEVEASIYMTSRSNAGIFKSMRSVAGPVQIIRAKTPPEDMKTFDFSDSPTWPELVGEFTNARDLHFPEATHFMPFEEPARFARLIEEHLERIGFDARDAQDAYDA